MCLHICIVCVYSQKIYNIIFWIYFLLKDNCIYNIVFISAIYQHVSAIGIHMSPPSWTSFSPPTPSHPSRLSRRPGLSSLSHTANSHWPCVLHMVVYMFPCYSLHPFHPLLPTPSLISMSILYVCISIAALNIGASVPLSRFLIYVLIYNFFFSFWLSSVCIIGSSFIYLISTYSRSLLWLSNIPLYICTTASLSIHLSMDI